MNLIRISAFFTCLLLVPPFMGKIQAGQFEEEMEVLRMFYKEKDLVVSATRHPKPVSHAAENITVVTAREIEEMNAHTLSEVLSRIPGLFVVSNQDFGSTSLAQAQGSEPRHLLVLLDGITWNFLSEGAAETNSIPVGIIDRIEIIKGPASSSWGSSLGGVINIITKPAGRTATPTGSISTSWGERSTKDHRVEMSGMGGPVGYYLFAGRQDSDGLRDGRYFDTWSLYSKIDVPVSQDVWLGFTIGYSEPKIKIGDFPSGDLTTTGSTRTFFGTASLSAALTRELGLELSFHHFKQRFSQENTVFGMGFYGAAGDRFLDSIFEEETTGGSGKLAWTRGRHTMVVGVDLDRGKLDQTTLAGSLLQMMGFPEISTSHPDIEKWAVYANDTIVIDRWSFTPGIRYDHDSISGSFVSPSLGITCRLDESTIARGSIARGFTIPPLSLVSGGGLFLAPNPSLEQEELWSYQVGIESSACRYVWLKGTGFQHRLKKAFEPEPSGGGFMVNRGEAKRQGFEIEAETASFYDVSVLAGFSYVDFNPDDSESGTDDLYSCNVAVRYDNSRLINARLYGRYVWWDLAGDLGASYDDFIWDLSLNRNLYCWKQSCAELFFTVHNLFNGSQHTVSDNMNPDRWIEAGLRLKF